MATKKSGGSSTNGRDSAGRRLGLKKSDGQSVIPGNIIMRQRGTKFVPSKGTGIGKDHTIFAKIEGLAKYITKGRKRNRKTYITVVPSTQNNQSPDTTES